METLNSSQEIDSAGFLNKYKLIEDIVFLDSNKIILSDKAKQEGWKIGLSFQEFVTTYTIRKNVEEEADRLKNLKYDVRTAMLSSKPFNHMYCLVYRDTSK